MVQAFARALDQLFTPPFRSVLLRSLGMVIVLFVLIGIVAEAVIGTVTFPLPGLGALTAILAALTVLGGMWFLIVPVTMIVAGIFLEEIAKVVEEKYYPADPEGRDLPAMRALGVALQFTAVVVVVNVALLPTLVFGIGAIAYFIANAYLIGREYFELVALRHMPMEEAKRLRRSARGTVWLSGALFTGLLLVPFVNLLVPLFATAFMVHIFKGQQWQAPRGLEVARAR
jgi:CysZ protein